MSRCCSSVPEPFSSLHLLDRHLVATIRITLLLLSFWVSSFTQSAPPHRLVINSSFPRARSILQTSISTLTTSTASIHLQEHFSAKGSIDSRIISCKAFAFRISFSADATIRIASILTPSILTPAFSSNRQPQRSRLSFRQDGSDTLGARHGEDHVFGRQ